MLVNSRFGTRGDTLIEVLFAIAIFSLVAVGGLSIMNQGSATAERALEITLVRNQIDAQAETLRFLNASYVAAYRSGVSDYSSNLPASQWASMVKNIKATGNVNVSDFGITSTGTCPTAPKGSFIMNTYSAEFMIPSPIVKFLPATTFAQVLYDVNEKVTSVDGIWIEAIPSVVSGAPNQTNAGYIDFNIRACWDSTGQSAPVTIGTIVRLYEPRG